MRRPGMGLTRGRAPALTYWHEHDRKDAAATRGRLRRYVRAPGRDHACVWVNTSIDRFELISSHQPRDDDTFELISTS